MRIYYLECLAQATYIISHEGAAFIVDPRRDVGVYIKVHIIYLARYLLVQEGMGSTATALDCVK